MTAGVEQHPAPEIAGAWLRAERLARNWPKTELARRLRQAAKAAGDNSAPSTGTFTSYVRRWEQGVSLPSERYRLLCCTALGIDADQYGNGHLPAVNADVSGDCSGVHIDKVDSITLQIPDGCREVVINLPCLSTRSFTTTAIAAPGGESANGRGGVCHV